MQNEYGVCKACGENLLIDHGDVKRSADRNMPCAASVMGDVARNTTYVLPKHCPKCGTVQNKNLIKKLVSFLKG